MIPPPLFFGKGRGEEEAWFHLAKGDHIYENFFPLPPLLFLFFFVFLFFCFLLFCFFAFLLFSLYPVKQCKLLYLKCSCGRVVKATD